MYSENPDITRDCDLNVGQRHIPHNVIVTSGKYSGERYTRLPVKELQKLTRRHGIVAEIATAELERRGVPRDDTDIDISTHAVNRASQKFVRHYLNDAAETGEGIFDWLSTLSREALVSGTVVGSDKIEHRGMHFVFELSGKYPLLKTIH